MSNLYYASKYKNRIINLLLGDENFIKLVDPEPNECDQIDIIDVMLGGEWFVDGEKRTEQGHIFDYKFADDTTSDERTFVFVETDIETVYRNTITEFNLYICIFTSKNLVRITDYTSPTVQQVKDMGYFSGTHGNRVDILCDITDKILNGNKKVPGIGTIKPAQRGFVTIWSPNSKYYGKCLKYNISNLNEGYDDCED